MLTSRITSSDLGFFLLLTNLYLAIKLLISPSYSLSLQPCLEIQKTKVPIHKLLNTELVQIYVEPNMGMRFHIFFRTGDLLVKTQSILPLPSLFVRLYIYLFLSSCLLCILLIQVGLFFISLHAPPFLCPDFGGTEHNFEDNHRGTQAF